MTEEEDRVDDMTLYEVSAVGAAILFCFGAWLVVLRVAGALLPAPVVLLAIFPAVAFGVARLARLWLSSDPTWQAGDGIPRRYWALPLGLCGAGGVGLAWALIAGAA